MDQSQHEAHPHQRPSESRTAEDNRDPKTEVNPEKVDQKEAEKAAKPDGPDPRD